MTTLPGTEPTLREVQQRIAAAIWTPQSPEADAAVELIALPQHDSVATRLHVYAGGYPARVHDALVEVFPAVAHVLGDGAFRSLTHRYSAATPLHSFNLNDAGSAFPEFLRHDSVTVTLPFLPDLATLELQVVRAFHAYMQPRLDPAPFAAWSLADWERAVLRFQSAVALVSSAWPVREIWDCRETPVEDIDVDLHDRPDWILVYRIEDAVYCESVDASEAQALALLLDGEPLGEVNQALADSGSDPTTISTWFARWMQLGLIVGVRRTSP